MSNSRTFSILILLALLVMLASPVLAGGIAIRSTTVSDNGDGDGFADTLETATVFLTIENTSGQPLDDVVLSIRERTPGLACVTTSSVDVGFLGTGEIRTLTDGFVFTVADVDRTTLGLTAYDDLSVEFGVVADSSVGEVEVAAPRLRLPLDLDVSGGSGSATYTEGFEGSLGTFEIQNLDAGLNSLAASDGYRCQYSDPDVPGLGIADPGTCYMGGTAANALAEYWGLSGPSFSPDGGRGFSGFHSLVFTIDMGPPLNWTTPLGVLEAAAMIDPVHIAADAPDPQLVFKHQASMADFRDFSLPHAANYDRAVVMVQVADDTGNPAGPWIKVDPFANPYRSEHIPITNCSFDPIDDGSTEDDLFSPIAGLHRGPSSTCGPEKVFTNAGETSNTFNSTHVGLSDGPALQGLWGIGSWVESRVDLSPFRGRSIRVRFLASTLEGNSYNAFSWEELFGLNPTSGEDGWWIDDVEITGLVGDPATVAVDDSDNSALAGLNGADSDLDGRQDTCDNCAADANAEQYDGDRDGIGDLCDICPLNTENFDPDGDTVCGSSDNCPFVSNPDQLDDDLDNFGAACDCNDDEFLVNPDQTEVNDGIDQNCRDGVDEIDGTVVVSGSGTISWPAQSGASRYQVVRAGDAGFTAACSSFPSLTTSVSDPANPTAGATFYYLVRSFLPNAGSFGADSSGVLRPVPCVP